MLAMSSPSFRGIFLTSAEPEKTASFYQDVALLTLESVGEPGQYVYWKLDRDGIQIAIHDARLFAGYAYPPVAESNLTHIYFKINDLGEFRAHLERMHVTPVAEDDVTVTVVDPDGRNVLFGTA
jgi:hypothetical protein